MARVKNNLIIKGISGQISQQLVIKVYGDKTILSRYPDMSAVKYNEKQKAEQGLFRRAVAYARTVIKDPVKKAEFQSTLEPGRKVFNAAISAFISEHKKKAE